MSQSNALPLLQTTQVTLYQPLTNNAGFYSSKQSIRPKWSGQVSSPAEEWNSNTYKSDGLCSISSLLSDRHHTTTQRFLHNIIIPTSNSSKCWKSSSKPKTESFPRRLAKYLPRTSWILSTAFQYPVNMMLGSRPRMRC